MEKLEIKHIVPYLAYGVDVCHKSTGEVRKVNGIQEQFKDGTFIFYWPENYGTINASVNYKLVLRLLSQLTKEIEVNGERFVPIDEIYNMWYEKGLNQYSKRILNQKICLFTKSMPYWVVEKLIEWHFDIFGLIEKQQAFTKE